MPKNRNTNSKENTNYRNVRKAHFTQVANSMVNDPELSLEGKGLMSIFLSNTEDWKINMPEIISRSKNGRDAHYRVVSELIEKGYFARITKLEADSRKFEKIEYIFSDIKSDVVEEIENMKTDAAENGFELKIEYQTVKEKKPRKKSPVTENQEADEKPFTESPETDTPNTEKPYPEDQYNNNTNGKNTNLNNTNDNNTNQPIIKEIADSNLPPLIQNTLKTMVGRLVSDHISVLDILNHYESRKDQFTEEEYNKTLSDVLHTAENKINNISSFMDSWLKTARERKNQLPAKKQSNRKEEIPARFDENPIVKTFEQMDAAELLDVKETFEALLEFSPGNEETKTNLEIIVRLLKQKGTDGSQERH